MNNKGFIEKLESRKDWKLSLSDSFNEGYKGGIGFAIDLATKIDEPEKVVVPKFVAEWIEEHCYMGKYVCLETFMCQYNDVDLPAELYNYYDNNKDNARDKVISAILNGYEVEKEQLYRIPLPNLVTSYGEQQFLSFDGNNSNYFASRKRNHLKQTFILSEVKDMPEEYKKFAVKVED